MRARSGVSLAALGALLSSSCGSSDSSAITGRAGIDDPSDGGGSAIGADANTPSPTASSTGSGGQATLLPPPGSAGTSQGGAAFGGLPIGGGGLSPGATGGAPPFTPGIILPPNPAHCPPTQPAPADACDPQQFMVFPGGNCRYPGVVCGCTGQIQCAPEAQCNTDADCPPEIPLCDAAAKLCVQCFSDAECSGSAAARCSPYRTCVECQSDADCPNGSCQPIIFICSSQN